MAWSAFVIAIDTNLLVYAHRAAVPEHRSAQQAIQRAVDDPRGCGTSLPCIAEFWSIVTHPLSVSGPSTPAMANRFIRELTEESGLRIWLPGTGFAERLLHAAAALAIGGARVFDLQIGLLAIEGGANEIWTHDRAFLKLKGLRVRDPLS